MALGIKKILINAGKGALAAGVGIDIGGKAGKLPERLPEALADQLKEIITAGVAAGMIIAANGIGDDDDE